MTSGPLRITRGEARRAVERYRVVGVHCVSCKAAIEGSLSRLPGVRRVEVDPTSGVMVLELEEGADRGMIVGEIRKLGYDVASGRVVFRSPDVRAGAEARVEKLASSLPGVVEARVYSGEGLIMLSYNILETGPEELAAALRGAGLRVEQVDATKPVGGESLAAPLALAAAALAVYLAGRLAGLAVLELAAGALAYAVAAAKFVLPAVSAARRGYAVMDTLVALGVTAAFALSLYNYATGGPLYFDSTVLVTLFVLAGRWVEARLRRRAESLLSQSAELVPPRARVSRGGRWVEVDSGSVGAGERVAVRVGERLPVDGRVARGEGLVDEAPLTGESTPRRVGPGSLVLAGSTLVQGYIEVTALRVGEYTLARRAVEAAREAALAKPRLGRLADRIASVFVYAVLAVAAATGLAWGVAGGLEAAVVRAATVLVVACPCTFGIAIPAALAAGVSRAHRLGVLVRRPDALDALARATVAAFDKTGTLTRGEPRVVAVEPLGGLGEEEILAVAAAAEEASGHVLADAIRRAAGERGIDARRLEASGHAEIPGKGVVATVGGRSVAVGNWKLMEAMGVEGDPPPPPPGAQTAVYVAVDGQLAGVIGLADHPRPEARRALERLERLGLEWLVLTGDSRPGAEALARALGAPLSRVRWGMDPLDKKSAIEEARRRGEVVLYVGDGVNDAPALAAADVGIAVNTALDAAKQSGDMVLSRDDLSVIPSLVELARKLRAKILQNLFWAFAYNAILIPAAAGALSGLGVDLNPAIAAAAMSLSSITVTGNSALLLTWKPRRAGEPLATPRRGLYRRLSPSLNP